MKMTAFGLLGLALFSSSAAAQTPYFQGKTIRIVVGYPAASAHDLWARMIAPQLTRHIPGNPATIVQNMSGAGSMTATNYVYTVAKPDGLTLGVNNAALYFEQLLKEKGSPVRLAQTHLDRQHHAHFALALHVGHYAL